VEKYFNFFIFGVFFEKLKICGKHHIANPTTMFYGCLPWEGFTRIGLSKTFSDLKEVLILIFYLTRLSLI